ncbi:hypothetical protein HA466_0173520 [Hirschfeldia incana]|nr:hypothetical protein HA466_0173520 [Hirschfeldia incana]
MQAFQAEWVTNIDGDSPRMSKLIWSKKRVKHCVGLSGHGAFSLCDSPFSPSFRSRVTQTSCSSDTHEPHMFCIVVDKLGHFIHKVILSANKFFLISFSQSHRQVLYLSLYR